ncbi:MAG: TPM domain-containing protein, partial [Lachnospiraceae bacterium]|nr:TPM domain-containing protein [Lachnospiraceae bacterium]
MIKCPGCGSALQFDPASQQLTCPHCSGSYDPESFRDYPYTEKAEEGRNVFDVVAYKCPNCGAELITTEDKAASFCSYCGSNVLLESQMSRLEYPSKVIPFKVTKEQAEKNYKNRLAASLYAPSALKKAALDRFRGIYMPYWSYDIRTDDHVSARGKKEHRRGDYIITEHYNVQADVEGSYESAYFDASSKYADELSRSVKPFETNEAVGFSPAYLSGFYADAGDVTQGIYKKDAEDLADRFFDKEAASNREVSRVNAEDSVKKAVKPTSTRSSISMFPVWFMSCRTQDDKRISYAAVNGQTGKVAADVPIDFTKYLIGSLLLAVPIFLLLTFLFTLTPGKAMVISIVLNIVGMLLLNGNINKAIVSEERLDDKGYISKMGRAEKAAMRKREEEKAKKRARKEDIGGKIITVIFIVIGAVIAAPLLFSVLTYVVSVVYYLATEETMLFIIAGAALIGLFLVLRAVFGDKKRRAEKKAEKAAGKEQAPPDAEDPAKRETVGEHKGLILLLPFLGILACVAVFIIKPVADLWYYGATILSILLMLVSIFQIIKYYNLRTTHRIPQLLAMLLAGALAFGAVSLHAQPVRAAGGYQVLIDDGADLLSDNEEYLLNAKMQELVSFGHVGFVSVDSNSMSTASFARDYYHSRFSTDSGTIFVIDMDNRMIYIFSDGQNYSYITDTKAESITDNVYKMASNKRYYACAEEVFTEVKTVLEGGKIAEPMKHISNALLALLISFLSNFLIVDFMSRQRPASDSELARSAQKYFAMNNVQAVFTGSSKRYSPVQSS